MTSVGFKCKHCNNNGTIELGDNLYIDYEVYRIFGNVYERTWPEKHEYMIGFKVTKDTHIRLDLRNRE